MKKVLFLLILCAISCTAFSQNIRKAKDILKLTKGCPRTDAFYFSGFKSGYGAEYRAKEYEFVQVQDVDEEKLTEVEKALIDKYEDVCFAFYKSDVFNCYWVRDDNGNVGMINFDGSVLVEPIMGNIVIGTRTSRVFVGECTFDPEDWAPNLLQYFYVHDGTGVGHFAGVVEDVYSDKIHVSIPVGKYDDIMLSLKGGSTFYFVGKYEDDNSMLWGVIDKDGNERLPIKYKGIYREGGMRALDGTRIGGSWVGSETMNMNAINYMVAREAAQVQERRQRLAASFTELASNLNNLAITMASNTNEQQVVSSMDMPNAYSATGNNNRKPSKEEKYNMSEQNDYNADKRTYANYDSMLSNVFSGNRSASLSEVKNWQAQMKKLREKWEKKGKSFPRSANEAKSYK